MTSHDATNAWDIGYHYAVRGINKNIPRGTWLILFASDFSDGYQQAILDGKWGSWNGN